MFNDKKGQSALEYLMTYGWALVVIVIVIAALFAFGVFNTPKQCTQTGGQLLIKGFDFNGDTIQLKIQNGSPDSVTVSSFSGSPDAVAWTTGTGSGDATLGRTDINTFFLTGAFTGNITEEITIAYTSGGLNKTEKTTCSGPV